MVLSQKNCTAIFPTVLRWEILSHQQCCPQCNFSQREPLNLPRLLHYFSREIFKRARVHHFTRIMFNLLHCFTIQNVVFQSLYCFHLDLRSIGLRKVFCLTQIYISYRVRKRQSVFPTVTV